MTTPTLEIHYADLMDELGPAVVPPSNYEFLQRQIQQTDIGTFQERTISVGQVRVHEITADFSRDCKISVCDEGLSRAIHLCLPMEGTVSGTFEDAGISASLKPKTHHYMFVQGQEYELIFDKEVKLAHIEFGLDYVNSLLCPSERWSAELQNKISKQQIVYSGGSIACRNTNEIIQSILHCELTGNLRKLFLEAKVMELVAIQLEHYRGLTETPAQNVLRKTEMMLMDDVKIFLTSNFTDEHSLQSIATHFGVNEFKLKKNFKLRFGQTIFDFLFDLKMDHAHQLLRDGNKLVNEVSREIGYKNPNHFATAFAKKFGVAPSRLKA